MIEVAAGDVLAVFNSPGLGGRIIRFGQWLQSKSSIADHVVIATHQDQLGRWIGIEGRPTGVGVCDLSRYLTDLRTRSNHDQPRLTDTGQLETLLASCAKSLGIAYDWVAITEDALAALHIHDLAEEIDHLWRWSVNGELPGHVVCSSLAAKLYAIVGWGHPAHNVERTCEPADWWAWSNSRAWEASSAT